MSTNRQQRLEKLINENLQPLHLQVIDESFLHRVPKGAQTHFKLIIVAEYFVNLSRIARHRLVQNLIQSEFSAGMHACSMSLSTPQEWQASPHFIASPQCSHHEK